MKNQKKILGRTIKAIRNIQKKFLQKINKTQIQSLSISENKKSDKAAEKQKRANGRDYRTICLTVLTDIYFYPCI